jgi:hypothetical protein
MPAMPTPSLRLRHCLSIALLAAWLGGCGGGGSSATAPSAKPQTPHLDSLSPASVQVGSPAFTLTVNGTGFAPGGSLSWGSTNLGTWTYVSPTQVTIAIAASLVSSQHQAPIVARNADPTTKPSNELTFAVTGFVQGGCVLFGTYDFFFTGFDADGAVTSAGAFGVDSAGHVNGEVDYKSRTETRVAEPITAGSCSNGADPDTGTLTITTASGTSHYTFVTQGLPTPGIRGRMAESGDANGVSGTGKFVLLKPGFGYFTGDYMMGVVGEDTTGHRMGIVGRFTDNATVNATGTITGGIADINDNGTQTASAALTGTVAPPDASSRSVATLTIGGRAHTFAFYVLRPDAGFAIDIDPPGSGAVLAGLVNTQYLAGLYGDASLNAPFVFSTWGVDPGPPASSNTAIGMATSVDGKGTLAFEMDVVAHGAALLDQAVPATYSIATNGRGTLSYALGGRTYNYVMYLDNSNDGCWLQSDAAGSVQYGWFEAQTATSIDISAVNGRFAGAGWFNPVSASPFVAAQYAFSGGNLTATVPGGALTGSYTISPTGRGSLSVDQGVFGGNHAAFYVIGNDAVNVMGVDPTTADTVSLLHQ